MVVFYASPYWRRTIIFLRTNVERKTETRPFWNFIVLKSYSGMLAGQIARLRRDDITLAKITTKPRFESANCKLYHELIPQAVDVAALVKFHMNGLQPFESTIEQTTETCP